MLFFYRLEQDDIEDGVKPNCDWWNGKDTDVLFKKYFFNGEWNDFLLAILRFCNCEGLHIAQAIYNQYNY